jgi:hypothetical protein
LLRQEKEVGVPGHTVRNRTNFGGNGIDLVSVLRLQPVRTTMSPAQQLKPVWESEPIFIRDDIDMMVQRLDERIAEKRRQAMQGDDFNARMQAASELDDLIEAREKLERYRARL